MRSAPIRKGFKADVTVVQQGEVPRRGFALTQGIACYYRNLPDRRRQILTFLLPGDVLDLHIFLLQELTYSIRTLTPARLAIVDRNAAIDIVAPHSGLARLCGGSPCRKTQYRTSALSRSGDGTRRDVSPIFSVSCYGARGQSAWSQITQSGCR